MTDVLFRGGVTLPLRYRTRAALRHLRRRAAAARLAWSGWHAVVASRRALRRARGAGLVIGAPLHREIQRALVAAGFNRREVENARYVSMW